MNIPRLRKLFLCAEIAALTGAMLGLSGCALGSFQTSAPDPVSEPASPGAAMQGKVIGGQNPINGGHVYLFAAGQSAAAHTYGTGATSLLTSAVLTNNTTATDAASHTGVGAEDGNNNYYVATDSSGFFSISSDYSCPGAVNGYPAEVYLLAVGGNSGGGTNSNIALMAALGPCVSASQLAAAVPYININEITTVAAVWALQQFMGNPTGTAGSINIGAPTTNLVGLQNAFTWAGNLANIANGTPVPTNTVATPEADRIYTIGDILSYCINSSSPSTDCANVFSSVKPSGTALSTKGVAASTLNAPADTIQAAWYLAQFPTNIGGGSTCGNAASAYACIQSTGAPFTAMSASPTDWTLAVGIKPKTGSTYNVDSSYSVVLDSYGNAWVDSLGGTPQVAALAPNGTTIYSVNSYTVGLNSGFAGYLNSNYGVTSGTATTHTLTSKGGYGMTIDSNGNVWMADYNDAGTTGEVAISGGSGYTCSSTCYFGTVAKFPAATGIGTASSSGVAGYYTPYEPYGAAADASGNVYFTFQGISLTAPAAFDTRTVGQFSSNGTYTLGPNAGVHSFTLAVDNNSNGPFLWIDSEDGCTAAGGGTPSLISQVATGSLTTFTSTSGLAGVNNTGCTGGSVNDLLAASTGSVTDIAFDASNNIWLVTPPQQMAGSSEVGPTGTGNTVTYGVVSKPASGTGVYVNPSAGAYASVTSSVGIAGLNEPQYAEVDGSGNLWVSNYGASTISEVNVTGAGTSSMAINSLSGANGFQHTEAASKPTDSEGIGIDLSGNVWVTSYGSSSYEWLTVLVGAATPVGPLVPGNYGVAP